MLLLSPRRKPRAEGQAFNPPEAPSPTCIAADSDEHQARPDRVRLSRTREQETTSPPTGAEVDS